MKRRGEIVDAVEITAARSARRVLTTGFTSTKTTGCAVGIRFQRHCETADRQAVV